MQWKKVSEWPDYEISDQGDIRRCQDSPSGNYKAGRMLTPCAIGRPGNRYLAVSLYSPEVLRKTVKVHRLVARAFLGEPPAPGMTVNHKNGNTLDNRLENLEWTTPSENILHAYRVLGHRAVRGELAGPAKISDAAACMAFVLYKRGYMQREIGLILGVNKNQIYRIINSKRRTKAKEDYEAMAAAIPDLEHWTLNKIAKHLGIDGHESFEADSLRFVDKTARRRRHRPLYALASLS